MPAKSKLWLLFAIITTLFWGVWGAFIEIPEKAGFPATLGYSVWALTMVPCAVVALRVVKWRLESDPRSVSLGATVGLLGAGGQLILFQALRSGPAYRVFQCVLSVAFLKERTGRRGWIGILLALLAIPMLSYQPPESSVARGYSWLILALFVFLMWGVQAYVMKSASERMKAESIFFYMMLTGVLLIPLAVLMTDFSRPVNWGFKGPYLAGIIMILNSVGALCYVYAVRLGKAIIVVPLTALAPVLTVILSLGLYRVIPHPLVVIGMVLASIAIYLMAE